MAWGWKGRLVARRSRTLRRKPWDGVRRESSEGEKGWFVGARKGRVGG